MKHVFYPVSKNTGLGWLKSCLHRRRLCSNHSVDPSSEDSSDKNAGKTLALSN